MLHNVYLYGGLARKYGSHHRFDIENAPQAARALCANFKTFFRDFKDGRYRVVIGDRNTGIEIDDKILDYKIGSDKSVHIIPVLAGSKNNGVAGAVKTVIGAVLIAGSFYVSAFSPTAGSFMFNIGLALVFGGVATLLTPTPKIGSYNDREAPDRRASFLFNGPTNRNSEGSAIPLVYGRIRTGSVIVSAGISVERL